MHQSTLFNIPDSDKWTSVNDRIALYKDGELCHIYVNKYLLFEYEMDNYFDERFAIVSLYINGLCSQREMAEPFGFHRNTINKWVKRYKKYGLIGLIKLKNTPKSKVKVTLEIRNYILSFDYDAADITLNYVVEKIKEKFDVELNPSTVEIGRASCRERVYTKV